MAASQLAIHVPPEANPESIIALLNALSEQSAFGTIDELLQFTTDQGIGGRTEMQSIAQQMGFLERSFDGIEISTKGKALIRLKSNTQNEIFHFLLYTGWNSEQPGSFLPAWAYEQVVNILWDQNEYNFTTERVNQLVTETIAQAETKFAELGFESISGVSFSPKSIRGIRKWLEALSPPVIQGQSFARRTFCLPELLLLALGWAFRYEPEPIGVPLLLSRERRELVCRLCLLDPASLDRTLDWMLPRFPAVIESGEKAGFYGRSIRFRKLPTIEDFAS